MSGRLSSLLDPSRINLNVRSADHTTALQEVAGQLLSHPDVSNYDGFFEELLAREQLDTTHLGHGIALPHARTQHVDKIVLAVGRRNAGVKFANCDEDVRLMFVLGTPKSNPIDYLMVVSSLCKIFKTPANREALMQAPTNDAFIRALVAAEEDLLSPA